MFAWKTCTHVCLVPYIVEYGSVSLVEFLHTPWRCLYYKVWTKPWRAPSFCNPRYSILNRNVRCWYAIEVMWSSWKRCPFNGSTAVVLSPESAQLLDACRFSAMVTTTAQYCTTQVATTNNVTTHLRHGSFIVRGVPQVCWLIYCQLFPHYFRRSTHHSGFVGAVHSGARRPVSAHISVSKLRAAPHREEVFSSWKPLLGHLAPNKTCNWL